MAYQKLQVGTGVKVILSDTINVPNVAGPSVSGAATSTTTNKLVDSNAEFSANLVGFIVYNTTDSTVAKVTAVDSATQLTLSANIMANGENYTLYSDTNPGCVLYSGNGGDIEALTSSGALLLFAAVPAGSFLPVQVKRVLDGNTSANNILALW